MELSVGTAPTASIKAFLYTSSIALGFESLNATASGTAIFSAVNATTGNNIASKNIANGVGATSNTAVRAEASGATTNYALQIIAGDIQTPAGTTNFTTGGSTSADIVAIGSLVVQGNGVVYANGRGNVSTNTFFGVNLGSSSITGTNNNFFGYRAGESLTSGVQNLGGGSLSLFNLSSGFGNVGLGNNSLYNISTSNYNIALGSDSGRFITGGATANSTSESSIYIGRATRANANSQSNQIVIGDSVTGNGSNTTTIGNASTILSVLRGTLNLPDCPTSSAGLNAGDIWSNSGVLTIV